MSCSTAAGSASASGGTDGRLQAPLAMTTGGALISPSPVVTRYPSPAARTDVTFTPVRTGARDTLAKRSMNSVTSGTVM